MAYSTWRYIVEDALSLLKKVEGSSDINASQVLYWASTLANTIRLQHIQKTPTGRYLHIFTGIPILVAATSANPDQIAGRKYFDLPATVYDIMNEKGIEYICHSQDGTCPPEFLNLNFQPTMPGAEAQRLTYSPYETPSVKNPYFYRIHQRIFLLGLDEATTVQSLEMGLYTSLEMRSNKVNLDDEIDLTEQHISLLRTQLIGLGSFAMSVAKDRIEDSDDETAQPKTRPVGVPQETQ